jgi:hypothetical protein
VKFRNMGTSRDPVWEAVHGAALAAFVQYDRRNVARLSDPHFDAAARRVADFAVSQYSDLCALAAVAGKDTK